jgi:hypothetical protein
MKKWKADVAKVNASDELEALMTARHRALAHTAGPLAVQDERQTTLPRKQVDESASSRLDAGDEKARMGQDESTETDGESSSLTSVLII